MVHWLKFENSFIKTRETDSEQRERVWIANMWGENEQHRPKNKVTQPRKLLKRFWFDSVQKPRSRSWFAVFKVIRTNLKIRLSRLPLPCRATRIRRLVFRSDKERQKRPKLNPGVLVKRSNYIYKEEKERKKKRERKRERGKINE